MLTRHLRELISYFLILMSAIALFATSSKFPSNRNNWTLPLG
ncbi:hypothetical protein [Fischerella sp.]|nr:hypothetical protein [Fischerella sp.]